MTLSQERQPTKAEEACLPHEVRLTLLDTNPVFQCLGGYIELNEFQFIPSEHFCSKLTTGTL